MECRRPCRSVELAVTREDQDRWALQSNQRAVRAIDEGRFTREITPVEMTSNAGKAPQLEGYLMEETVRDKKNQPRAAQAVSNGDWDGLWVSGSVLIALCVWRWRSTRQR